jgi:hypothetical protein
MPATSAPARITGIYRYPVKGLTPEQLARAELGPGQTLLADRRYAIENGPSGFNPAEPKWLPKPHFLMLMRDEWLASLRTQFDDSSNVLSINHNGRTVAQGNLATPEGRRTIENFFASTFPDLIKGPPKVLESPATAFPMWPARLSPSSIFPASAPSRTSWVRRCIRFVSAPISMSRAGRPGTNSTSSTGRFRSAM